MTEERKTEWEQTKDRWAARQYAQLVLWCMKQQEAKR